jgi:methionyl-tRNA synthetase
MALGLELPKQVFGHGWLVMDGGKMSKSKGNVIDPLKLVEQYGVDAVRYFLLREVPFGADGNFSNEALVNRINSDLANDLGNLVSRTVAMVEKYFDGVLPVPSTAQPIDDGLKSMALSTPKKMEELMDKLQFSNALSEIWALVARSNKYIDETMPWVLARDEAQKERLGTVLYNLTEVIRMISVMIQPYMPNTSPVIWKQIGVAEGPTTSWQSLYDFGAIEPGTTVKKGPALFPRIQ